MRQLSHIIRQLRLVTSGARLVVLRRVFEASSYLGNSPLIEVGQRGFRTNLLHLDGVVLGTRWCLVRDQHGLVHFTPPHVFHLGHAQRRPRLVMMQLDGRVLGWARKNLLLFHRLSCEGYLRRAQELTRWAPRILLG